MRLLVRVASALVAGGRPARLPQAHRLLINADGGGSDGYRTRG
jgi:hypothetical protein